MKRPHKWKPSTLGHGETQCEYCYGTNREIAVIGDINHCDKAPVPEYAGKLLPCPFCGSVDIDPEGWYAQNPDGSGKRTGPACDGCGAAAETVDIWNTRQPANS